jgi:ribosome maturation factor RimP
MKIENKVEEIVEPIINNLGFDLEYVEFVKEGSNNVLRVVIDKVGENLWVDDCENVSRAIEDVVDNNIKQEYVLEVSSPGLERQLKTLKLYKKYMNQEIHIKLFKKQDDLKEFNAHVISVDDEEKSIVVKTEKNTEVKILLKDIATAYTTYDFNSALKGNTDNVNLNKLNKFNKNK